MTVKIDAFAKRAAIGLKTLPHPLDLTAYRQFLYGIFSSEDRASMQLSNKTVIAIKKLSVTKALRRGTSRIPAFGRSRLLSVNHLGLRLDRWTPTHRTRTVHSVAWPCGLGAPVPISAHNPRYKRLFATGAEWCSTFRRKRPWKAPHLFLVAAENSGRQRARWGWQSHPWRQNASFRYRRRRRRQAWHAALGVHRTRHGSLKCYRRIRGCVAPVEPRKRRLNPPDMPT